MWGVLLCIKCCDVQCCRCMEVCERVGTSRMIVGVAEVITIKCRVVLGEKRPQMPARGELWQLLLFQ